MKIGEFAKKHDVAASAVRFYIELGLLIPRKNGSQHVFTSADDAEMTIIKELKKLGYSLKEMQKYISTVRLYQENDSALNESLITLLTDKEDALLKQKEEIETYICRIHDKAASLQQNTTKSKAEQNDVASAPYVTMPITFIPMLQCPYCGKSLQMKNAEIIDNGIKTAALSCSCGYNAEIRNGMLFTGTLYDYETDSDFNRWFFGVHREAPTYEDIFFESSSHSTPELMILQHKALLYLQEHIRQMNPHRHTIIVPDIACHQLYKLHNEPYIKESLILVITFSHSSVVPIQKYLNGLDLNILYVINQDGNLPFKKETADAVIDYTGILNFSFFNSTSFLELFSPYIKPGAELLAFTECYETNAKSLDIIRKNYKFSDPSIMTWKGLKNSLTQCGFELTEKVILGSCGTPGEYWEYHHPDDKRHAICYKAKKSKSLK